MILCYTTLTLVFSGAYVFLIIYILSQWASVEDVSELSSHGKTKVSFIIPARNEGNHIAICLRSIIANLENHELEAEIIVIDDHSQDNTVSEVKAIADMRIKLIHLSELISPGDKINAYKKIALQQGLNLAQGAYIIQLDADVTLPKTYLEKVMQAIHNSQAELIAAPVLFKSDGSHFQNFQSLDMMGMMAVTAAGISSKKWYLANGANLIYKKGEVSYRNDQLASGDDITAIQSIAKKATNKIEFLKNRTALVTTHCEPDIHSFYNQRIRWATKNKYQSGGWMRLMMAIPYINVMWLLFHFIGYFIIGPFVLTLASFQLLSKIAIDYIYLKELAEFFGEEDTLRSYGYSSLAHIVYIAIVGTLSLVIKKYPWKGRKVS